MAAMPPPAAARAHDLRGAEHHHGFRDAGASGRARALGWVTLITLATMGVELAAGWLSGSLALLADGWHMGTHAFAIGGAWLASRLAARAQVGYAFGGWKIEVLTAYTSGLALLVVAAWILVDAAARLLQPVPVAYDMALSVALIGLAVNVASALLLMRGERLAAAGHAAHEEAPGHVHAHSRDHGHAHPHGHDHNYAAAYLHVVADAFTSVLAIVALAGGAWFGWTWLDPAVALLGAAVIARWAFGVLRGSARALVDATEDPALVARVRAAIESDGDAHVADLHVWQVGGQAWCAAVAIVADMPLTAAAYRERLAAVRELRHVTVEVHRCAGC